MIAETPTIAQARQLLKDMDATPLELLEHCLGRCKELDDSLKAWVHVFEEDARRQIELIEESDTEKSPWTGNPMAGIPIGIKDVIDVADWTTACGSDRWWSSVARRDGYAIHNLRKKNTVFMGKTTTCPYAGFDPTETVNPWNRDRTPGGSSAGSAVAVATGMCMAALGTQTGGSTIRPASYCGVPSFKFTYFNQMDGIQPLAHNFDTLGFIGQTVEDLSLMYEAFIKDFDYESDALPKRVRIGRLRGMFEEEADEPIRKAFEELCGHVKGEDFKIVETRMPGHFKEIVPTHRTIMKCEAFFEHEWRLKTYPEDYPPKIKAFLAEGGAESTENLNKALTVLKDWREKGPDYFFGTNKGEVLICPATNSLPPGKETTGDPKFQNPWTFLGWPVVSMPIGWSDDGLPICIQLIGPPHSDRDLLKMAVKFEKGVGFKKRALPKFP